MFYIKTKVLLKVEAFHVVGLKESFEKCQH